MSYRWVSWVMPGDMSTDYRPVNFPPNEAVLGWWCTGYSSDDSPILCAMVRADSEEESGEVIRLDWPEFDGNWRFNNERESLEMSDRFPQSDWSKARFEKAKQSL